MEDYKVDEYYLSVVYELRGKLLQTCIDLEMVMDSYIAEHFCESNAKVYELATLILAPRIPWREKLAIFWVLIEKYNQEFKDEYPEFSNDIINVIEHRNVVAHLPADLTPNGFKLFNEQGIVAFLKFKNSKMPVTKEIVYVRSPSYINEEINGILIGVHTYTSAIHKMLRSNKV